VLKNIVMAKACIAFLAAFVFVHSFSIGTLHAEETAGGLHFLSPEELANRYDHSVSSAGTTFLKCKIDICGTGSIVSFHLQKQPFEATERGLEKHIRDSFHSMNKGMNNAILDMKIGAPKIFDLGVTAGVGKIKFGLVDVELKVTKEYASEVSQYVTADVQSVTIASSSLSPRKAWFNASELMVFAISLLE
jgi:hypothetical protein